MGFRMGTPPIIDPVAAGSSCSVCWGQGKTFGAGETPESITVIFENIEKGPNWTAGDGEPANGEYILQQRIGVPCSFGPGGGPEFVIDLNYAIGFTALRIATAGFKIHFRTVEAPECKTVIGNTINDIFTGGTATIRIPGIL